MRRHRYLRVQRLFSGIILLILCCGIFQLVTYSTNRTAVRIWELWERNRVLNEEALRQMQKYDIILSAYMNSGSTYTGRLLGFRDDAFYFYEPLWRLTLWGYFKSNSTICSTRSLSCRQVSTSEANRNKPVGQHKEDIELKFLQDNDILNGSRTPFEMAQRALSHVFHCRLLHLKNLVKTGVTDNPILSGPSWDVYRYCIIRQETFENCLKLQSSSCKQSTHRVSKVLRVSLGAFENLLQDIPNLKVIHLFRDPRAIIHSRLETIGYPLERATNSRSITNNAKALCNKLSTDLEAGKRLAEKFPNRFRFIHYEDIYTRDYSVIELHTFLGMSATKSSLELVRLPLSSNNGVRSLSARSERSGNNAYWWRKYLRWDIVKQVDTECSSLYAKLGYPDIVDKNDMNVYNETALIQNLTFSFL